ncbi:MAG: YkgJ family cysteine cluster protein [Synergistales bacterium]|nr:YkgJ family cysteine cluster protein [Synergistales bacterium]
MSPENQLWWHRGLFFGCIGCGRCCRGAPGAVWLTPEEERRIADFLGIAPRAFARRYMRTALGRPSLRERRNGDCIFYDPHRAGCAVYPVRPLQCALFPFWPSVLESPETWAHHAADCPGMNDGAFHSAAAIRAALRRAPFSDL